MSTSSGFWQSMVNVYIDGAKCADPHRRHGMSEETFYNCKAKFGEMAISNTSILGRRVAHELTARIERRGKPGVIVSDNGTMFRNLARARGVIAAWAADYNTNRPPRCAR